MYVLYVLYAAKSGPVKGFNQHLLRPSGDNLFKSLLPAITDHEKLTSLILAALNKTVDKPREGPTSTAQNLSFEIQNPIPVLLQLLLCPWHICAAAVSLLLLMSAATGHYQNVFSSLAFVALAFFLESV